MLYSGRVITVLSRILKGFFQNIFEHLWQYFFPRLLNLSLSFHPVLRVVINSVLKLCNHPVVCGVCKTSYAVSLITQFVALTSSALSSLSLLKKIQVFKILQHSGTCYVLPATV